MDAKREILRHMAATVAYRLVRAIENAPAEFAEYEGAGRRPVAILAHMGDLMDWALSMADGSRRWHGSTPLPWEQEKARFFAALTAFDAYLASDAELQATPERLEQGPLADALTHVGQIAMLRRMAGHPARGENFFVARIAAGQTTEAQPEAVKPF